MFNAAASYNEYHQLTAKDPQFRTIQLGVGPGFATPSWFFTSDGVTSCDGLFTQPTLAVTHDCDFTNIFQATESGTAIATPLPLPWSALYKAAWKTFLNVIAKRHGTNPLRVTMQVTGPTASSEEMILPNQNNEPPVLTLPEGVLAAMQASSGQSLTTAPNISALTAWDSLIANHYAEFGYYNTDQAFIDEWEAAIDLFGQQFSGTTLSVSTGNGLPNFSGPNGTAGAGAFPVPSAFPDVCVDPGQTTATSSDCVAEWTILQYFAQPGVGGYNGKSTQMDGLNPSIGTTFGPKMLSSETAGNAGLPNSGYAQASQMMAGLQEGWSPVANPATAGCTAPWPSSLPAGCTISADGNVPVACATAIPKACLAPGATRTELTKNPVGSSGQFINPEYLLPPQQALYNDLLIAFMNTVAGNSYGALPDPYFSYSTSSPLNYLQVWSQDIVDADNSAAAAPIAENAGASIPSPISVQQELNMASEQLLEQTSEVALPPLPDPPPPPKPPLPPPCPPGSANCHL